MRIERIPTGMKQVEIDPKKMGRQGHQMVGQSEALNRWIAVLQQASVRTRDRNEKRIVDDILVGMFEDLERIQVKLADIANTRGALKVTDQFIEPDQIN